MDECKNPAPAGDVPVRDFYQKLSKYCTEAWEAGSCKKCPFLEFCYSPPKNYTDELLSAAIAYFS